MMMLHLSVANVGRLCIILDCEDDFVDDWFGGMRPHVAEPHSTAEDVGLLEGCHDTLVEVVAEHPVSLIAGESEIEGLF